ncbi:hypothetical protein FOZ60_012359 [Perkinsus olseni]|uniref:Uncharacterized protein n=1 Tax=Perkinsus olseni TaxID=32597 RepID=A0A7J6NCU2_PEROL|nr:hypothetical protein FOZ60_012359 [Perkinsus olseni]
MSILSADDAEAMQEVVELGTIPASDLPPCGRDGTTDAKLVCRILHCKAAPEKPLRFTRSQLVQSGGNNNLKKMSVEQSYHKWILCGCLLSSQVVVIITRTSSESELLLKFTGDIYPGSLVAVVEPEVVGQLEGGTKLIRTSDRLIPIEADEKFGNIPKAIELSLRYQMYHFFIPTVEVIHNGVVSDRCPGVLCDAQTPANKQCPCQSTDRTVHKWAISLTLKSSVLNRSFEIVSHQLTALFADPKAIQGTCPLSGLKMRRHVRDIVSDVNEHGGWSCTAWVKPGRSGGSGDDSGAIQETKLHVCSLRPAQPTPELLARIVAKQIKPTAVNRDDVHIRQPHLRGPFAQNIPNPNADGVLPAVDPAAAAAAGAAGGAGAAGAAGGAAAAPANQAANVPHVLSPTQVQAALAQIRAAAEVQQPPPRDDLNADRQPNGQQPRDQGRVAAPANNRAAAAEPPSQLAGAFGQLNAADREREERRRREEAEEAEESSGNE